MTPIENITAPNMAKALNIAVRSGNDSRPAKKRGKAIRWTGSIAISCMASIWLVAFIVARDFVYRIHGKWFRLKPESFDAMHYAGMGLFKGVIVIFNLVPYLVLRFWF